MPVSRSTVIKAKANYTAVLRSLLPVEADIEAFIAVIAVEAGGDGIDARYNRPIIRFEVHQFYALHGYLNQIEFDKHFKFDKIKKWMGHYYCSPLAPTVWIELHKGSRDQSQIHEWYALNIAMQLDPLSAHPAIESCSWGAGQIMGFHWSRLGYTDVLAFMRDSFTMPGQIGQFVKFVQSDPRLYKALQAHDWKTFARYYNGTGQIDLYAQWIADAYALAK